MAKTGNSCELCGKKSDDLNKCKRCDMVICPECLKKTRNRTAPCNCIWDTCNGWLEPISGRKEVPVG